MPEIVVTEGDKGRSFQARIGDSIVVRLPETPRPASAGTRCSPMRGWSRHSRTIMCQAVLHREAAVFERFDISPRRRA